MTSQCLAQLPNQSVAQNGLHGNRYRVAQIGPVHRRSVHMFDPQHLFVELLHRLTRYSDAIVLSALLERHGDVVEVRTSVARIALDIAGGRRQGM